MIGTNPSALVYRMRVAPLQQDIFLRAHHEEGGAESEHEQALKIDVATIHDVERARFREDRIKHVDVMHFAVRNANKRWDIAMQVKQSVEFDGGLLLAEVGPREQRKTQVDGGGVQRIQACIQIDADRIARVQRPCCGNQDLRKICEDPPMTRLIGIGQSGARNLTSKSHVIELASH